LFFNTIRKKQVFNGAEVKMEANQIGENLKQLRLFRKIKQDEIAKELNITTAVYRNLEKGKTVLKENILQKIANFYKIQIPEIIQPVKTLEYVRFRDHKKLKSRDQILIAVGKKLAEYQELKSLLSPSSNKEEWEFGTLEGTPKELAEMVRDKLNLNGSSVIDYKPVTNICGLLEEIGVKVIPISINSYDFFGLSVDEKDGGPCIAVNTWERIPVERWIFSAVHELGHLLKHKTSYKRDLYNLDKEGKKEEKEANIFASLFLMPEVLFNKKLEEATGLTLLDMTYRLKRFFNVSYKAILYRLSIMGWKDIWRRFQHEFFRINGRYLPGNEEPKPANINEFSFEYYTPLNVAHEPKRLEDVDFVVNGKFCRMIKEALEQKMLSKSRAAEMLQTNIEDIEERIKTWKEQKKLLENAQ